jgi:hypothetical protein
MASATARAVITGMIPCSQGQVNDSASPAGTHSSQTPQVGKRSFGIDAAREAPVDELRHVHAPLADFGLVDPHVRHEQLSCQIALGEARVFAEASEHRRQRAVASRMLGLCRHRPINVSASTLVTFSLTG